jgi:metal-responsive CopG/Arc/MetJ family transcriptional regulator
VRKTINLSITQALLEAVDGAAQNYYMTRSEYVRQALIQQLKAEGVEGQARRQTSKAVPRWAIRPSKDDEYRLADDYKS